MSIEKEIVGMLQSLAEKRESDIYPATVMSVEGVTCTVKRLHDGRELHDVRLSLTENDEDGLVITPVIGSQVLVANVNKYSRFICQYSLIEKVTLSAISEIEVNGGDTVSINSGDTIEINGGNNIEINTKNNIEIDCKGKIEIDAANNIKINDGTNGRLVVIQALTDEINELVKEFNRHKHGGVFTDVEGENMSSTPGTTGTPNSEQTSLKRGDYENKKITH